MAPFEKAIESVKTLALANDVYFLSAPSVINPHSYTKKRLWIEKYFGIEMCHKLILTPNKGLNKGDIYSMMKNPEEDKKVLKEPLFTLDLLNFLIGRKF